MSPTNYNRSLFGIPKERVRSLGELEERRSVLGLASVWLSIVFLVTLAGLLWESAYFWFAYPVLVFFIAGRQGALLQLVHESAHCLLSPNRRRNYFYGEWLCALPIGVFPQGYTKNHVRHHTAAGTEEDPPSDKEKYKVSDARDPKLYLLLLKDLIGITALRIFFSYGEQSSQEPKEKSSGSWLGPLTRLCLVQLIVFGALFHFDLVLYLLLWLFPAAGPHMFLMRIRGIAEHGLAIQLHKKIETFSEGDFYTRSMGTPKNQYRFALFRWIERLLIGSFFVNYHHEHHLFPNIPFYNLKALHYELSENVHALNPNIYEKGYFAAAFRTLRSEELAQGMKDPVKLFSVD